MSSWVLAGANIAAIVVLVFGIYFPRHRRRDMVVAYLGINAGVLAVASVLSSIDASVGLGLGMFGVLSVIRLRSDELDQREVAYYFVSLALGLLGGTAVTDIPISLALMAGLVLVLFIGDHPLLLQGYRSQQFLLDRAFVNDQQLAEHLAALIRGRIVRVSVKRVDLVTDTTLVDVRYVVTTSDAEALPGPVEPHLISRLAPR